MSKTAIAVPCVVLLLGAGCAHGTKTEPRPAAGSDADQESPSKRDVKLHPNVQKLMTADPQEFRRLLFSIQVGLARLGYFSRPFTGELDARTVDAIISYRGDAKLAGEYLIDKPLFDRMDIDESELRKPPRLPLPSYSDLGTTVSASGTWVGIGERFAYPFNHVELKCYFFSKSATYCAEAEAHVDVDSGFLRATVRMHDVETWTKDEITTVAQEAICAKDFIRLNRVTKEVKKTRVTTNKTDPMCAKIMIGSDFDLRLVDGDTVWKEHRDRMRAAFVRLFGLPPDLFNE